MTCDSRYGAETKAKYDILLVPANWAAARGYAWRQLLIARAIENQALVVGANRSGHDDYGDYNGLTYILDPFGKDLASSGAQGVAADGFLYAEYSRESLEKYAPTSQ